MPAKSLAVRTCLIVSHIQRTASHVQNARERKLRRILWSSQSKESFARSFGPDDDLEGMSSAGISSPVEHIAKEIRSVVSSSDDSKKKAELSSRMDSQPIVRHSLTRCILKTHTCANMFLLLCFTVFASVTKVRENLEPLFQSKEGQDCARRHHSIKQCTETLPHQKPSDTGPFMRSRQEGLEEERREAHLHEIRIAATSVKQLGGKRRMQRLSLASNAPCVPGVWVCTHE